VGWGYLAPVAAIHPSGRMMVAGSDKQRIPIWDLDHGTVVAAIEGLGAVQSPIFDTDGSILTCGTYGIHRWPVLPPGANLAWQIGPPELVFDGNLAACLITRNRDGSVLVVSLSRGAMVLRRGSSEPTFLGPQSDVRQIAVSPDGRWVATGSWTSTNAGVFVWDTTIGGSPVATLPVRDQSSVSFSPDGKWLATGGDGRLWSVGSWQPGPRLGQGGNVWFSPDGSLLLQAVGTGVRLCDPDTGKVLATLDDPFQERSMWLASTPDATRLVYTGDDAPVYHVWDLRRIREQLKPLGLDWHRPDYPPAAPEGDAPIQPLLVNVESSDLIRLPREGLELARKGLWVEGAAVFEKVLELAPQSLAAWRNHAHARLAIHDRDGYRTACGRILDQFGTTDDALTANNIAWLACMAPDSVEDPDRLVSLAESALAKSPGNYNYLNTLGATLYRAGRFPGAVQTLDDAIRQHGQGGNAWDFFFLAMAHHRLGHGDEASVWIRRAGTWMTDFDRGVIQDRYIGASLDWDIRLELRLLEREAEALLGRFARELPANVFAEPAQGMTNR
jgi:tetratricopeptide (TPR) repeat protein